MRSWTQETLKNEKTFSTNIRSTKKAGLKINEVKTKHVVNKRNKVIFLNIGHLKMNTYPFEIPNTFKYLDVLFIQNIEKKSPKQKLESRQKMDVIMRSSSY
jgi:hypothetical protein